MSAPLPPPPARYRASHAAMGPMLKAMGQSCRAAYELMVVQQDRALRPWEAMQLRTHLLICSVCRRMPAQLAGLRYWVRQGHAAEEAVPTTPPPVLSAEARQRIQDPLRAQD